MTGNDEPTAQTIAAIAWLMEDENRQRWEGVLMIWARDDFARWLKIFSLDSGKMSIDNVQKCVDWGYVADTLLLQYIKDNDQIEQLEMGFDDG